MTRFSDSSNVELASGDAGALRSDFLDFAATLIQSAFRGYVQRKSYTALKRQSKTLQHAWLSRDRTRIARSLAATILQRAWRSFSGRKALAYYKSLIALHERGDPREVLKMVNPREADMMDAAAGLHVRFRLDGSVYPPRLVYKIFTHRPVTDICAFCPRDYAGMALAAVPTTDVGTHNTQHAVLGTSPAAEVRTCIPQGWYQRHENNSWRPVDSSCTAQNGCDLLTRKRSQPVFHYSSKVRAAHRIHRQKMRRRDWLVALYSNPMPEEKTAEPGHEADNVDLMQWCEGLDFDKYISDWRGMATTMASDAFIPVDEILPELPAWSGTATHIHPQWQHEIQK